MTIGNHLPTEITEGKHTIAIQPTWHSVYDALSMYKMLVRLSNSDNV